MEKSKRQMQKSGSEREERSNCRFSIFMVFSSFTGPTLLKAPDRNRINRRGVKSNHTSALWISTSRRRRNHARGVRRHDYNAISARRRASQSFCILPPSLVTELKPETGKT